jgi:hypothetical protein
MIDNVLNDFKVEDRCPMCYWNCPPIRTNMIRNRANQRDPQAPRPHLFEMLRCEPPRNCWPGFSRRFDRNCAPLY